MRLSRGRPTLVTVLLMLTALGAWSCPAGAQNYRVVDAETKEPIEGAVVIIVWSSISNPGAKHAGISPKKVMERLTDENGEIYLMPGVALARSRSTIVYKPGYRARIEITQDVGAPLFEQAVVMLTEDKRAEEGYRDLKDFGLWPCLSTEHKCIRTEWVPHLILLLEIRKGYRPPILGRQ